MSNWHIDRYARRSITAKRESYISAATTKLQLRTHKEASKLPKDGQVRDKKQVFIMQASPEFLRSIKVAIESSDDPFQTKSDFVREAVKRYVLYVTEGGLKHHSGEEQFQRSSEEEKKYESDVKAALNLIKDLEDPGVELFAFLSEPIEDFVDEAKKNKLLKSEVWTDRRVQVQMRKILRDDIYPKSFWDEKRTFSKKEANQWIKALSKGLQIDEVAAKNLVIDPSFVEAKGRTSSKSPSGDKEPHEEEEEEEEE